MKKFELLAPAGDSEKLKTAVYFGADACYFAGKKWGLRAFSNNFEQDGLRESIAYAHSLKKRAYITVNIQAHNKDFDGLAEYLRELESFGADAIIISDAGILALAKKTVPNLKIHLSTQASASNKYAVKFWAEQGASRVILARELSLEEIKEIHEFVPEVELEVFVHGAMCISYSGRCLLSNYMAGRDSNRGECAQCCRWEYTLHETKNVKQIPAKNGATAHETVTKFKTSTKNETSINQDTLTNQDIFTSHDVLTNHEMPANEGAITEDSPFGKDTNCQAYRGFAVSEKAREGEYFPIEQDERGTYVFNSKDLCLLEHLDKLVLAGVTSFKIEGRMKSAYYVATVVNAYRRAIDILEKNPEAYKISADLLAETKKASHRNYTTGFLLGATDKESNISSAPVATHEFIAVVTAETDIDGFTEVEQRNRFTTGDILEVLSPNDTLNKTLTVKEMKNKNGDVIKVAQLVQERLYLKTILSLKPFDILRKRTE